MVSIHVLLILLTNRNLTLIYSVIKKQRIVHRQRTFNINCGTVVVTFNVCGLS